jgi:hypothetical protein
VLDIMRASHLPLHSSSTILYFISPISGPLHDKYSECGDKGCVKQKAVRNSLYAFLMGFAPMSVSANPTASKMLIR